MSTILSIELELNLIVHVLEAIHFNYFKQRSDEYKRFHKDNVSIDSADLLKALLTLLGQNLNQKFEKSQIKRQATLDLFPDREVYPYYEIGYMMFNEFANEALESFVK